MLKDKLGPGEIGDGRLFVNGYEFEDVRGVCVLDVDLN